MGHLYQSYVKFSGGHLVTPKEILPAERNEVHLSCESSWSKACGCNWFKTREKKNRGERRHSSFPWATLRWGFCHVISMAPKPCWGIWCGMMAASMGSCRWSMDEFPKFSQNGQSISYEAIVRTLGPPWLWWINDESGGDSWQVLGTLNSS